MPEIVNINNTNLAVKEWKNQRVITFKDIDDVHERPEGTARHRFNENKDKFIENEDYYVLKPESLANTELDEKRPIGINEVSPRGTIFLTESGYLMLVKSLNDDKAWEVQRTLVNTYFKAKEVFTITEQQYNALLNNYNTLVDKLNELSTKLIVNTETTNKLDCRVACIESGISVSGGRLSPWVKEMSSKVMELADCYEKTVKKMYSLIIEHMEDKFGLFFNGYYSQYVADHPNEKTIWRIVVIEYYDLNDLFESAYKDLAKEIGLYPDNRVDVYYEF